MTILTARRRALKVRPVLESLDDRVLLDVGAAPPPDDIGPAVEAAQQQTTQEYVDKSIVESPSVSPSTYEPESATDYDQFKRDLSVDNIKRNPDIEPGVPDLGPAIAQSYGQYASTLLGVVPDQGPSYNPPLGSPDNPAPMGQHVIDAAISQILVGEYSKDLDPASQQAAQPVGAAPAPTPDPDPDPVGLNPAGPPYPYEPIVAL